MENQDPEEKRHSGNWLLIALVIFAVIVALAMFQFGNQALNMSDDAKTMNKLLHQRTLSCAEPVDPVKCKAAINAIEEHMKKLKDNVSGKKVSQQ